MSRFPSLAREAMSPEQRAVADAIAQGPRGGVRGPFIALLHNPALAAHVQALGEYLRFRTALPAPLLELAVLVTARRWSSQYEWHAHAALARKAGLPEGVIDAVARGAEPPAMSKDEALVHAFARAVVERGEPAEADYDAAERRFGRDGVLDLLALCGYYSLLAFVLNTARIPLPEGAPPPLPPLP